MRKKFKEIAVTFVYKPVGMFVSGNDLTTLLMNIEVYITIITPKLTNTRTGPCANEINLVTVKNKIRHTAGMPFTKSYISGPFKLFAYPPDTSTIHHNHRVCHYTIHTIYHNYLFLNFMNSLPWRSFLPIFGKVIKKLHKLGETVQFYHIKRT